MSVSTEQIKELREETGAGVLDCRNALEETNGDLEQAIVLLREKGLAKAAKRAGRETQNGILELYSHGEGRVGVMVEVNCETDFVARTEQFREFAHEIALQIAATSPRYIEAGDVPEAVVEEQREFARSAAKAEGKPENVIERIVEGKINKFLEDNCLLLQEYIRDDARTVNEVLQDVIAKTGELVTISRFERWEVGERLE
jgi:elongation factor Ts